MDAPAVPASPPPRTSKPDVLHLCTNRSAAVEQYGSEAAEQLRWYRPAPHLLPTSYLLTTDSTYHVPATRYRTASHWSSFVPRMLELMRSDAHEQADEVDEVDEAAPHSGAAADDVAALATDAAAAAISTSTSTSTSTIIAAAAPYAASVPVTSTATATAAATATSFATATAITSSTTSATPAPSPPHLRFYLAADSAEAYEQLTARFWDRVVRAPRTCDASAARCDFRDCGALLEAMVDLLNLAHCGRLLGSGWSSYTEVAARWVGGGGGDEDDDEDSDQALPLERAGIDFARPLGSDGSSGAPGDKRCTCAEPGNPRPSHNGYYCRTGDSEEVGATYSCPLRQACVPGVEWAWDGAEHRPCALWTGTAWEYNSKRTPTTNSWAAPPITVRATLPITYKAQPASQPLEAGALETRIVGLARLRNLTAKATATLTRLRDRAQGQAHL